MYSNNEVDDLVDAGRHASKENMRNEYYEKAEWIIVEDAPWVFFWHDTEFILRQPWIRNYKAYPVYSMDKGLDISI
jgi:ABC-type transport system substrate-binding protein